MKKVFSSTELLQQHSRGCNSRRPGGLVSVARMSRAVPEARGSLSMAPEVSVVTAFMKDALIESGYCCRCHCTCISMAESRICLYSLGDFRSLHCYSSHTVRIYVLRRTRIALSTPSDDFSCLPPLFHPSVVDVDYHRSREVNLSCTNLHLSCHR